MKDLYADEFDEEPDDPLPVEREDDPAHQILSEPQRFFTSNTAVCRPGWVPT